MDQPDSPRITMTEEARRQLAFRRLIEDALRHGYAKRARSAEEEQGTTDARPIVATGGQVSALENDNDLQQSTSV